MSYFKKSFTNSAVGWTNFMNDHDNIPVLVKNHDVSQWVSNSGTNKITCKYENMAFSVTASATTSGGSPYFSNLLSDPISSGTLTISQSASNTTNYGEEEFDECDAVTFYNPTNGDQRTLVNWTGSDNNHYAFHTYDKSTTHNASFATDNPDVAALNASFDYPVIKDFGTNYRTQIKLLNAPSSNYVIQPIVAFGVKTPIYSITGGNDSDMPLFSEIEVNGTKYFTIGTNYCVKM